MQLLSPSPEWEAEARLVLSKHLKDPRYPKNLTTTELVYQARTLLRGEFLAEVIARNQERYRGIHHSSEHLRSLFIEFLTNCDVACWSSWHKAWVDFMDYERRREREAIKSALSTMTAPVPAPPPDDFLPPLPKAEVVKPSINPSGLVALAASMLEGTPPGMFEDLKEVLLPAVERFTDSKAELDETS